MWLQFGPYIGKVGKTKKYCDKDYRIVKGPKNTVNFLIANNSTLHFVKAKNSKADDNIMILDADADKYTKCGGATDIFKYLFENSGCLCVQKEDYLSIIYNNPLNIGQ
jgi:hypothetical protein